MYLLIIAAQVPVNCSLDIILHHKALIIHQLFALINQMMEYLLKKMVNVMMGTQT